MSINHNQLRALAIRTLVALDPALASHAAVDLVLGTAAVESDLGTYIRQLGGPALGICQMEPATFNDLWDNWLAYKPALARRIRDMGIERDANILEWDLRAAMLFCRLHYRRVRAPLPGLGEVHSMAAYWKRYYNTTLGAGDESDYVRAWHKHFGDV